MKSTFLVGANEILPIFMHFWSDLDNIVTGDAHKMFSHGRGFRENRHSGSHILLRRVSQFLSVLSKFIVRFG
jgi:hypothetical protein